MKDWFWYENVHDYYIYHAYTVEPAAKTTCLEQKPVSGDHLS